MALFCQYTALIFFNYVEAPAYESGLISISNPRAFRLLAAPPAAPAVVSHPEFNENHF